MRPRAAQTCAALLVSGSDVLVQCSTRFAKLLSACLQHDLIQRGLSQRDSLLSVSRLLLLLQIFALPASAALQQLWACKVNQVYGRQVSGLPF